MRYLSAGFSHGAGYTAVLEGLPAGLKIDEELVNFELKRRQLGIGRSERMSAEQDSIEIISGIINGATTGAPVSFLIRNRLRDKVSFTTARPGHADLTGFAKYGLTDLSIVAESASGRSTVTDVAVGAICKQLLAHLGISVSGKVLSIGGASDPSEFAIVVQKARDAGDTVGGCGEVCIKGVAAGFGSYVQRDRRLDGMLASAIVSIPSVKSVEFGFGAGYGQAFGSDCLDLVGESTNYAGGIEGGISNGRNIVCRFAIKPPPSVASGLMSVDVVSKKKVLSPRLRSDVCIAESVTVVAESVAAYQICNEILHTLGGDTLSELTQRYNEKLNKGTKWKL